MSSTVQVDPRLDNMEVRVLQKTMTDDAARHGGSSLGSPMSDAVDINIEQQMVSKVSRMGRIESNEMERLVVAKMGG